MIINIRKVNVTRQVGVGDMISLPLGTAIVSRERK